MNFSYRYSKLRLGYKEPSPLATIFLNKNQIFLTLFDYYAIYQPSFITFYVDFCFINI